MRVCELVGAMRRLLCVIFLANSSENAVRATAGCELLRVRAARVVTLKNRVRWCEMLCGASRAGFLANSS